MLKQSNFSLEREGVFISNNRTKYKTSEKVIFDNFTQT